ncbi:hypothetical protein BU23DRAFT_567454 [Bimuria novae-zelandiae CBS 107.79]|uniref:DDE-1 domain-containing protein n=1 Tax=Bimuria novae-zelandiae CBS 107.79 TaxID=1447943 RepID=A0A6A5VCV5_9PLEO|nr:hypothetical protein BU23DRAFT_567454 [Bimuria novae-zelandiae CBS 107.79]
MDEKGVLIGIVGRSKRIFSRRMWEKKEVRASLQDGNRAWITLLACICADGSALPPSLIYEAANKGIQSSWVEDIKAGEHEVFITSSSSSWTNNDIGLAWLEQPLDVTMFKPLLTVYLAELSRYLHRSQGLASITKDDFFPLFWNAWKASFKESTILSSFRATGISPPVPNPILDRFAQDQESGDNSSSGLSDHDWRKMDRLEKRDAREAAKKAKEKERAEKAAQRAAQKSARDAEKALQLSQRCKRKASQPSAQSRKRPKRVVDATDVGEASEGASAAPSKSTRSGRDVKLPDRFK